MSNEKMTIREMCELFGVTPRTLRFYETKELLSPERVGQKRLYSRRDRARLKLIQRGKRFGFNLDEIKELLDLYSKADDNSEQIRVAHKLAEERLEDLKEQRRKLDAAIKELDEQIRWGRRILSQYELGHQSGRFQPSNVN